MSAKYNYDDFVEVITDAPSEFNPGKRGSVIAIFEDRKRMEFKWLDEGTIYTVEFMDSSTVDIPEKYLTLTNG